MLKKYKPISCSDSGRFDLVVSENPLDFYDACAFARVANSVMTSGFSDWVLPDMLTLKAISMLSDYLPENDPINVLSLNEVWSSSRCDQDERAYLVNFTSGHVSTFFKSRKYRVLLVRESQRQVLVMTAINEFNIEKYTWIVNLGVLSFSPPKCFSYDKGSVTGIKYVASCDELDLCDAEAFHSDVNRERPFGCEEWLIPDPLTLLALFVIDHEARKKSGLISKMTMNSKHELSGFYWTFDDDEDAEFVEFCHYETIGLSKLKSSEKCKVLLVRFDDVKSIVEKALNQLK